jgi:FkbM family methyltransferase
MLKKIIHQAINSTGYTLAKSPEVFDVLESIEEFPFVDLLEVLLRDLLKADRNLFFMQIGAHDGSFSDPISHLVKQHHWQGILVEPQPRAFQKLRHSYQGEDQLIFEQALVGQQSGLKPFYSIRFPEVEQLSQWLEQSASLDRQQLVGALYYCKFVKQSPGIPDDFESLIEETFLPMITVEDLLSKHQVSKLDLLVIDTIGHDFEIIRSFPFDKLKPAVIHFEHSLLSERDRRDCLMLLKAQGYKFAKVAVDTIACLEVPVRQWQMNEW